MKLHAFVPLVLLLGACTTEQAPQYALATGEKGVFTSRTPGVPIAPERIKGMTEQQLVSTFGAPALDRKDEPARVLRYQSDACTLFVYLYRTGGTSWQAQTADALDTYLRPLPVDQCAGSVSAQKRRIA